MVADDEAGIRSGLMDDGDDFQLDLLHAIRDASFALWKEDVPLNERREVSKRMYAILWTLVNSVRKHGDDGDRHAIDMRVELTLVELHRLSHELKAKGYYGGAAFIEENSPYMVTFARLAAIGIDIPYTSNIIENVMKIVSMRCKHIGARWSTKGLENMMWMLLVRHVEPDWYEEFWKGYISKGA